MLLQQVFPGLLRGACDAVFADSCQSVVWGISGLDRRGPVLERLAQTPEWSRWREGAGDLGHLLLDWNRSSQVLQGWTAEAGSPPRSLEVPTDLATEAARLCRLAQDWGGTLLPGGIHSFDPRDPAPGPHFGTNLLLGDRIGYPNPLQTTPKSVLDAWGRGSFRSHAATQVLATRWDLRQEENGFPANRQFYLTEGGRQVFYSADPEVADVRCEHGPNRTVIRHRTADGLTVERTFFLAPQETGLPLAAEVQHIRITNAGTEPRSLRLVSTGMFGPSKPGALMEDVLYSTIILQAGVLRADDGSVLALSPDYCPLQDRRDLRFHTLRVRTSSGTTLAREFGTSLGRFLAGGTLEHPRGLAFLGNLLDRRGPGFFALAAPVPLAPGASVVVETFTGLVSHRGEGVFDDTVLAREVTALLDRYAANGALEVAVARRDRDFDRFAGFLRVSTANPVFNDGVNRNLPFQVLYQSFASRSFCQTQKGYREIGFREIQDLFAGMLYFQAAGKTDLVADLLGQWASQVHEFGYANHNFYWEGKEPGLWSDDALWLVQAVARYIDLTSDWPLLSRPLPMAGGGQRSLFETLKAIVRYSGEVSLGAHGLPLLDRADWNDCLKIDTHPWSGPEKETQYRRQAAEGTLRAGALNSDFSESVMNAFLLKVAADQLARLAQGCGEATTAQWAQAVGARMAQACQTHAWKERWFCRLLVNRPNPHPIIGAAGDGLASDDTEGSYFLNSFTWAILSKTAREDQIGPMFEVLETRLKTDHGYRLVSTVDLRRVEPTVASAEYFPGDRENGAVFKHASMMAVAALFEAAGTVTDSDLARRMARAGWWMIDLVLPSRCLEDPYRLGGNPRFCTQYNNSETGQNIGPLLSGTAPWLVLALLRAWGIRITSGVLALDPLLRESDTSVTVDLQIGGASWHLSFRKPEGFVRATDRKPVVSLDGRPAPGLVLPLSEPGDHRVEVVW